LLVRVARPLRLQIPGGIYHVRARGNSRAAVYRDDRDRRVFLELFERVVDRFGWICHAYCQMGNHYHLLLQTPLPNLSSGMRQLNGVYAQGFNKRHRRVGHVFEARFGATLVEEDGYFLELARYIVLNPVRAGIVDHPRKWPWSSYRATAGESPRPLFLTTAGVLGAFAADYGRAQRLYTAFVEAGIGAERPACIGDIYNGSSEFADRHAPKRRIQEIPRRQWDPVPPSLEALFAEHDGEAIATAYRTYGYTLAQIAEHLGVHYSTVSRRLRKRERP
jgi:putative transposase